MTNLTVNEANRETWLEVIQKYMPGATEEYADWLLWEKTCFPMGSKDQITKQVEEHMITMLKQREAVNNLFEPRVVDCE